MRRSSRIKAQGQFLSVNKLSWKILGKFLRDPSFYGIRIERTESGATIIDAGVNAKGGYEAGRLASEICMGGCAEVEIAFSQYGSLTLPSTLVRTDHPMLAVFASQLAGWQIRKAGFSAIGSGPARALALKPREVFEKIQYKDDFDKTIIVLETDTIPPTTILNEFAQECHVSVENLSAILMPTTSMAGTVQISARIVEVGMHKLEQLGLDPNTITQACGCAPIAPRHPEFASAMSRTNDAILYGGTIYLTVDYDDEAALKRIVNQATSQMSKNYGKSFLQIFSEVGKDFYKVEPGLFAPAMLVVNNTKTGRTFQSGRINVQMLAESFGF